ncbi:AAA family ATPase [Peptoniphilus sp. KCTC 25270]|uniref:ATP-binding protein n=1 Tax=Peptoniphilus sp. KCTC 25270 TaxID=2897414 RepID=UPI001E5FA7D2|nr:AAA family ATPase [Peptoniphilus sp. KCTC 25270]MCD1147225.1 AAA family ATPase [Peptoniphilus sp. KCTC 25270]
MIERIEIYGFGKFQNTILEFSPGFNGIYGENEAGKSTLFQFIVAMFYGFSKDSKFKKIYNENWDSYRPLETSQYGGTLDFSWRGRSYRLERNFLKDQESCKVWDLETKEIWKKTEGFYTYSRIPQPGALFFQLSQEEFLQYFALQDLKNLSSTENIEKEILKGDSFLQTGALELSLEEAFSYLGEEEKKIGTMKALKTPLGRLEKEIQTLERAAIGSQGLEEKYLYFLDRQGKLEKEREEVKFDEGHGREREESKERASYIYDEMNRCMEGKAILMDLDRRIDENNEKMDDMENRYPWIGRGEEISQNSLLFLIGAILGFLGGIGNFFVMESFLGAMIFFGFGILFLGIFLWKQKREKEGKLVQKQYMALFHLQDQLLYEREEKVKELQIPDSAKSIEEKMKELKKEMDTLGKNQSSGDLWEKSPEREIEIQMAQLDIELKHLEKERIEEGERQIRLKEAKKEREALLFRKEAIEKSRNLLASLSSEKTQDARSQFYGKINDSMEWFTKGRYKNIRKGDEGFYLTDSLHGKNLHQSQLSTSTLELLLFSIRLSMMDAKGNEEVPILLEDAFVHMDEERSKQLLITMRDFPRQVLWFTSNRGWMESFELKNINKIQL